MRVIFLDGEGKGLLKQFVAAGRVLGGAQGQSPILADRIYVEVVDGFPAIAALRGVCPVSTAEP